MRKGMLFNKKEYSKFTTMKRMLLAFFLLPSSLFSLTASAQGIPFIRNYTSDEYHANNTNFDIETDEYGNVFAANFEERPSLLCALDRIFDNANVFTLKGNSYRGKELENFAVRTNNVKAPEEPLMPLG